MALTAPRSRPGGDRSRRDLSAPWRHVDPILLVCTLAIAALGTLMVFSATKGSGESADLSYVRRQVMFMGIGVVPATRRLLEKASLRREDLDLVEMNEAFAAQVLACNRELGLDPERLNVNGGAIALGHPIGATGARIAVTLLHEMARRKVRRGLATLCISGGMGLAAASGQLFLTLAFASGPPARVSVVGLTQVGFAVLYDLLLWDRSFETASVVGIALVVAPTAWLVWTGRGSLGEVEPPEGLSEVDAT